MKYPGAAVVNQVREAQFQKSKYQFNRNHCVCVCSYSTLSFTRVISLNLALPPLASPLLLSFYRHKTGPFLTSPGPSQLLLMLYSQTPSLSRQR